MCRCQVGPEKDVRTPGIRNTDSSKVPCRFWESNWCPLPEKKTGALRPWAISPASRFTSFRRNTRSCTTYFILLLSEDQRLLPWWQQIIWHYLDIFPLNINQIFQGIYGRHLSICSQTSNCQYIRRQPQRKFTKIPLFQDKIKQIWSQNNFEYASFELKNKIRIWTR